MRALFVAEDLNIKISILARANMQKQISVKPEPEELVAAEDSPTV